jgi:xanthine dehydrogenase accessory factor
LTRPGALLERAVELDRAGRPYALATVVAVRRPTSARPGARGLIQPDGTIEGFVGGSCARPLVVREALRALADGQPRLLRISREAPAQSRRADGIVEEVMTCHSGGTLEIYIEPHLPAAALWIAGTSPIALALAELAPALGYAVGLVDPVADPDALPGGINVVVGDTFSELSAPAGGPFIVVASQGVWDEEALAAALALEPAYVGLVASPTRAAAVRTWLLDQGLAPERVLAVRAPAGLDLGAETAAEVALSILAELVTVRRGRASFVAAPGPAILAATTATEPALRASDPGAIVAIDPVCAMTVDPATARHLAEHGGLVYAFCSIGCRTRFMREPEAYVPGPISSDR